MTNLVFSLILIILIAQPGCKHENNILGAENPEWLDSLIAEMSDKNYYFGTVIYRHRWHNEYYYHVEIPVSSCAYCDVYNASGEKVPFSTETLNDYLQNRKNEKIIWRWGE